MLLPRPQTHTQSTSPTYPHFLCALFPMRSQQPLVDQALQGWPNLLPVDPLRSILPDSLHVQSTETSRESEFWRTISARALVPTGERTRTFPSSSSRDARWLRECLACSFSEFHAPYEQLRILFYLVVLLESLRAFRGPGLLDLLFMIRGRRIRWSLSLSLSLALLLSA